MLTVDFSRLGIADGDWVLDIGCGFGRHAYGAAKLGANVVACDMSIGELHEVRATAYAIQKEAEYEADHDANHDADHDANLVCAAGDITDLPFPDGTFNKIVASEVLEHIVDDVQAMNELHRVLAPGGVLAVTVPAYFPEKICWKLSDEYHAPKAEGGHVRVYTRNEIRNKLAGTGFLPGETHFAHALHSPYWWLRCLVGPNNSENRLVKAYHRFLCWELMKSPQLLRVVEQALNPILGKSLVVYAKKQNVAA